MESQINEILLHIGSFVFFMVSMTIICLLISVFEERNED